MKAGQSIPVFIDIFVDGSNIFILQNHYQHLQPIYQLLIKFFFGFRSEFFDKFSEKFFLLSILNLHFLNIVRCDFFCLEIIIFIHEKGILKINWLLLILIYDIFNALIIQRHQIYIHWFTFMVLYDLFQFLDVQIVCSCKIAYEVLL